MLLESFSENLVLHKIGFRFTFDPVTDRQILDIRYIEDRVHLDEHLDLSIGFTQTQERSYPTGIDSPDEEGSNSPVVEEEKPTTSSSQSRRRVQIMNDSDNEDDQPKSNNRNFLKQMM